jgi:hypothetical protein
MATAVVFAVPSGRRNSEFEWKWRCDADGRSSVRSFAFYYDCVTDALSHGYSIEMIEAKGDTAPGGPDYALDAAR